MLLLFYFIFVIIDFWGFFLGLASEEHSISVDVIRKAFQATEDGFLSIVAKQWTVKPQLAAVGTCCLVGVICSGTLYIANVGDSRAVLGRGVKSTGEVIAIQLSIEHNASIESIRQELRSLHPDDPQIVVLKHNVWRVKGLIQVCFNSYMNDVLIVFLADGMWFMSSMICLVAWQTNFSNVLVIYIESLVLLTISMNFV